MAALPVLNPVQVMPAPAPKKKWWVPYSKINRDLFEKIKKDINHFLAVSQEGVPFSSFSYEFEEVTGSPVPFRELGFKTIGELLFHMEDVVNVRQDNRHGTLFLYVGKWAPIGDEIVHIRQLVIAQGISDKTKSMSAKGKKGLRLTSHDVPIEVLLTAEREMYAKGIPSQQRVDRSSYNTYKPQNPNRFAPWRDDRVRAVSEAGEPIRSEEEVSFSMSNLLIKSDTSQSSSGSGPQPSRMSSLFASIPESHFHAM